MWKQAVHLYHGQFDWLAIGDDDTAFLYNRAMAFLSHIDHTKVTRLFRPLDLFMRRPVVQMTHLPLRTTKRLDGQQSGAVKPVSRASGVSSSRGDIQPGCLVMLQPAFCRLTRVHASFLRCSSRSLFSSANRTGLIWRLTMGIIRNAGRQR